MGGFDTARQTVLAMSLDSYPTGCYTTCYLATATGFFCPNVGRVACASNCDVDVSDDRYLYCRSYCPAPPQLPPPTPPRPPVLPAPPGGWLSPPPASPPPYKCDNTCAFATWASLVVNDGTCDDSDWCERGTDCDDCGPRYEDESGRRRLSQKHPSPPPSVLNIMPTPPSQPTPPALALCECNPGFYDPIVYADNATKLECKSCPYGTTCNSSGTTVHSLVIHFGYFRVSNDTADVRSCPDHASVASFLSKPSGCAGGEGGGDSLCRDKLGGVYCRACRSDLAGSHYYNAAERECLECGLQSIPAGFWLLLALLSCACLMWLAGHFARGRLQDGADQMIALLRRIWSSKVFASLTVTAKTLIGFYQIVSEVEEVFIMELPVSAVRFIESFSWLDLSIVDLVQLECIGLGGYHNELRLTAATPAVLIVLMALGSLVHEAAIEQTRGGDLVRAASLRMLPSALLVTFLVVPDISSLAFQSFRCECFGDESWLRSDYSLQCTSGGCEVEHRTTEYLRVRFSAWLVLCVYAIGVPCVYALLLIRSRRTIMDEEHGSLADALAFLHGDYHPSCYGWEVVKVAQKLVVVGFVSLILPGTLRQLVIVVMLTVASLMLLMAVRPFRSFKAWLIAMVEQMSLLIFMVICLVVKTEQLATQMPELWMTEALHKQYFYETEFITSTMASVLVAALTFAALMGLHDAAPVVAMVWREGVAFGLYEVAEKAVSGAELRAAARADAHKQLRGVLDQRASTLEVPEILHSDEATINPVLRLRLAEKGQRARQRRAMQGARARDDGGASSSNARPERLNGALGRLRLDIEEAKEQDRGTAAIAHVTKLRLKRHHGVQGLVREDLAPDEVARLRSLLRSVARKAPVVDLGERRQLRQLATLRDRLESRGWAGAEKISPRTR